MNYPNYLNYLPVVLEVLKTYYKPQDQFISSRNVAAYILDDPTMHARFDNLKQTEVRKICSFIIRKHFCGVVMSSNKNRSFYLPSTVGELEVCECASA